VGSALCGQIAPRVAALGLLDHADHGLLEVSERVERTNPDSQAVDYLCDIRDQERLTRAMTRFAPDTVIHCAALKHVHLGERHPGECVLTNLVGMRNALVAANQAGARRFMLISTDKAAAPVCVMGATKRLAELFLSGFQRETRTDMQLKFVRFGNVMGSQGSVLPRFEAQIAEGGPLQITHPDMKRFFMSSDEAVRFIEDALWAESGSEPAGYFKDMGEPISIVDLGERLIAQSGRDIAIEYTGLRPGERLNEQLFDEYETATPSAVAGMFELRSGGAYLGSDDVAELEEAARMMDDAVVRQRVMALVDSKLGRELQAVG
jgi:O-antigen biosynthesis protein WbqV